jgi:hypothetical protein
VPVCICVSGSGGVAESVRIKIADRHRFTPLIQFPNATRSKSTAATQFPGGLHNGSEVPRGGVSVIGEPTSYAVERLVENVTIN